MVRECYRQGLMRAGLEDVEIAALSVLPCPDGYRRQAAESNTEPGPRERYERAIEVSARAAMGILSHGPASGDAGAEVLYKGGTLEAEVRGLSLEAEVDLIWRRPDGRLEIVLVREDSPVQREDGPSDDGSSQEWRSVLALSVVRANYGEQPDLHTVWTMPPVARISRIAEEKVEEELDRLRSRLEEARRFKGLSEYEEGVFYRLGDQNTELPCEPVPTRGRLRRSRGPNNQSLE